MNKKRIIILVALALVFVCGVGLLLPSIRDRVVWHLNQYSARVQYALFPPTEVVFVPQSTVSDQAVATAVEATVQAANLATPTAMPTAAATTTPQPSATAGPTATPIPASVLLSGIKYEDQHGLWNYCAPATLSMALSYWGWQGDRTVTGKYLKPFDQDLNVMPYEMANFIADETQLGSVLRYGGTLPLLKQLLAGGFPVVIEKGVMIQETTTGQTTWMGHYNVVVGYDDAAQEVIVRDSYYSPPKYPLDYKIKYDEVVKEMQAFNYVFLVIYPPDQKDRLDSILGSYTDETWADKTAAQMALDDIANTTGADQFFAWYNRGTSLVALQDYAGAASAYDQAFNLLSSLPEAQVPKKVMRMVWYQTGPYFAYYYTGRYQDVVNLANQVLTMPASGPYLEESFYWRAMAEVALGETGMAVEDLQTSLKYHPGFGPSTSLLTQLGY